MKNLIHITRFLVTVFFLLTVPAISAEIDVDGTDCTLIEAIESANADDAMGNGCADGDGADIINLPVGSVFTLTEVNNTTSVGPNGLPQVNTEIIIEGNGSTIERDDAAPNFRILEVGPDGVLTINKLKITNGLLTFPSVPTGDQRQGGGIYNRGTLTINHSEISGNTASDLAGGIRNRGLGLTGPVFLTINNSTISDNFSNSGTGGISSIGDGNASPATVIVNNSTISGNTSSIGTGGGISSGVSSTMTILNSTITNNSAGFGGGIANSFNTNASISNSIVAGNSASNSGPNCRFSSDTTIINDGGNNLSNDGNTGPPANEEGFSSIRECFDPSAVMTTETDFDVDCLDVLDFYGGVTQTHALINPMMGADCEINLALNVSGLDCSAAPISDLDQRLFPRDSNCDIGAFELQDFATVNVTKVTVPADGTGYIFDATRMGDPALILGCFILDDTQSQSIISPVDTITVSEEIPEGFELSINCDASTDVVPDLIDNDAGTVDATLDADDILDCTFTNTLLCDVDVNVTGTGQGTVTGDGIDCDETNSPTCSIQAGFGSMLDFTATADSGSTFVEFTGDCSDPDGIIASVGTGDDINGCSDTCTAQFSDIDDCSPDPCQNGGACTDTGANSFSCDCTGTGYEGDTCDTDVDECTDGTDNCSTDAACTNTVGSFTCACNEGFTGDGITCTDIDACVNNPCGDNATCTDSPAPAIDNADGRTCECNAGHEGDGITCTDIDACTNNPCDTNATCTDNPAPAIDDTDGRTCECNEGFAGNGNIGNCNENEDIEIGNETTDEDGVRVSINVGDGIAGGGRILVNLPPSVLPLLANLNPDVGECEIVDNGQSSNVTESEADVICEIDDLTSVVDLNIDLCKIGEQTGVAVAEIDVEVDNSDEDFSDFIQIILNELDECEEEGDGNGGCSIASSNSNYANALSNFFVTLIPAVVGFAGLFWRRRY